MDDNEKSLPKVGTSLAAIGAGILILVCCAGPALFISGSLGFLGGVFRNPWLIVSGFLVLVAAIAFTLRKYAHRSDYKSDAH